ncbi:hypothetical protein GY15_17085 [Delftia sp. 670]|nr:hypothetical protein GY15_17085 [Delftia sp. 670]
MDTAPARRRAGRICLDRRTRPAGWWKAWGDESLNTLVEEALAANLDLSQAQSRLRQQRLLAGTAGAAFRPVFTAGARTLQDIAAIDSYFHASIDVSWDLGLFGAREAGERNAAAAVLDARGRLQAARVAWWPTWCTATWTSVWPSASWP